MSSVSNQLEELFDSKEFAGRKKILISSAGTSQRNNLRKYLKPDDLLYAEVLPNPSLNQLFDFFRIIRLTPEDIVFGIGGGSVIDFSKLVALFASIPNGEIKSLIESAEFGSIEKALRLVVVPTLFGSGAEQTPFAVCYIGNKKYSVANSLILPERVEYVPEMNISANSNIKLANVLDCFCQAAESLTAQNANQDSVELAKNSLRILVPIAKDYINCKQIHLATKMAKASMFCGNAIAISKTTGPHAMSYYLTSKLKWKHGIAVAMAFIFFFENYQSLTKKNLQVERVLSVLQGFLHTNSVQEYFKLLGLEMDNFALEIINSISMNEWLSSINIERLSNGPDIDMRWLSVENMSSFYKRFSAKKIVSNP